MKKRSDSINSLHERYEAQFSPKLVGKSRNFLYGTVSALIAGLILGLVLMFGFTQPIKPMIQTQPNTIDNEIRVTAEHNNITLHTVIDEDVVFTVDRSDGFNDLKVASTTHNTFVVKDNTRAQFIAGDAALSKNGYSLAYIRTEDEKTVIDIIDLRTGGNTVVDSASVKDNDNNVQMEPCIWSSVVWSPDGSKFAVYGCYKNSSKIMIFDIANLPNPTILSITSSTTTKTRDLVWASDSAIIYTFYDATKGTTSVRRTDIDTPDKFLLIYEL